MIWKSLYKQSAKDQGTLLYFKNCLNRVGICNEPKKKVDATVEFLHTVVKGHWLAHACNILGISSLTDHVELPKGLLKASKDEKKLFVEKIATKVVEQVTLIDCAFSTQQLSVDTDDSMYNYARVLCHYGSLTMEMMDAWAEGDGERVIRCWRLFLPHFQLSGSTKYALEAFRVQLQTTVSLSPNLAHQVKWHRFVNTKGGMGRNIPCDLYNEHINKLIKFIIRNMGSNLTENSLQRAARSVSTLNCIANRFDDESVVQSRTSAHSTRSDTVDVKKVMKTVTEFKLLQCIPGRKHRSFPEIHLNPLHKWDRKKSEEWVKTKKKEYEKFRGILRGEGDESDSDATD